MGKIKLRNIIKESIKQLMTEQPNLSGYDCHYFSECPQYTLPGNPLFYHHFVLVSHLHANPGGGPQVWADASEAAWQALGSPPPNTTFKATLNFGTTDFESCWNYTGLHSCTMISGYGTLYNVVNMGPTWPTSINSCSDCANHGSSTTVDPTLSSDPCPQTEECAYGFMWDNITCKCIPNPNPDPDASLFRTSAPDDEITRMQDLANIKRER
jgi:hypothetical protein